MIYAAAKEGWAIDSLDGDKKKEGVEDLLNTIVEAIPAPDLDP